jgi:hypothetical protein
MSPPSCLRSRRTTSAGWSASIRELRQPAPVSVRVTTTFSTWSSQRAKARSRGSAFSSSATAGQKPPKPW